MKEDDIHFNTHPESEIVLEGISVYRVIHDERKILWEVIGSVILRNKVYMNMCLILNCYGDINTEAL
jgi:hypothetical protein